MQDETPTDHSGPGELRMLAEPLREAAVDRARGHEILLAVGNDRAAVVATDDAVLYVTRGRGPDVAVRRVRYDEIAGVATENRGGAVDLRIDLDGSSHIFLRTAARDAETVMQAATVLNLLSVDARRGRPVGLGLSAEREHDRFRGPAADSARAAAMHAAGSGGRGRQRAR